MDRVGEDDDEIRAVRWVLALPGCDADVEGGERSDRSGGGYAGLLV